MHNCELREKRYITSKLECKHFYKKNLPITLIDKSDRQVRLIMNGIIINLLFPLRVKATQK